MIIYYKKTKYNIIKYNAVLQYDSNILVLFIHCYLIYNYTNAILEK